MIFISPLISQTSALHCRMGTIFERICVIFSRKYRFLLFGAVVCLSATPISLPLHPKILRYHPPSWHSLLPKNLSWCNWLSPTSTHGRILSILSRVAHLLKGSPYDKYKSPEDEARYWEQAEQGRKALERCDARFVGADRTQKPLPELPPLVMYYTPALPPLYRDEKLRQARNQKKKEGRKYYVSCRTYCKWHRMVFPNLEHPTISQASRCRVERTPAELQQIHRISQMLPDAAVFPHPGNPKPKISPKYRRIWQDWKAASR